MRRQRVEAKKKEQGIILATLMIFLPVIVILTSIVISVALQAYRTTTQQELIRQTQLAAASAMDYAKEQYELDLNYSGTPETTLYDDGVYRVTFEVISKGYSNATNTQQDIQGFGRVYENGSATPLYVREIQGKVTNTTAEVGSARFIFIIDNSGSMTTQEWLDSKSTVDAAITYVLNNSTSSQVAVVQYGTNNSSQQHKYDITVPFTDDPVTATTWDRRYGTSSPSPQDYQDHLPGSLARMRLESVYGPGDALDLVGATDIQYVFFTDAWGTGFSYPYQNQCCSVLKKTSSQPSFWTDGNGSGFSVLDGYGEYNQLKDGTVFAGDGYPGLTSQFTVLSINDDDPNAPAISAAIASPGGNWNGAIDANSGDPEGNGILPRRFISTSLAAGADEIVELLQEVIDQEINF